MTRRVVARLTPPEARTRAAPTAARPTLVTFAGRPAWILAGQLGIVLSVVLGFQAYQPVKPNLFVALLLVCIAATVALGPARRISHVVVTLPVAAVIGWWLASLLWTNNLAGWRRDTELFIPVAVALVALVGLLPTDRVLRGLLVGCQVAIAWTVVFTILDPATATTHPDGLPGWTGGFIHKNAMAPFMLFAILVAWSFEPHVWRRRLVYGVATFYIVMSQSTTALALLLVIVPLGILFHRIARADAAGRSAILVSSLAAGALVGLVLVTVAEALLATRGKDLTLTRRTVIWDGVWQAIERRPIAGYGAGGVWLDLGREPARSILRPLGFPVFHSHNGYLEVALHLGLVGLALVLVLMGLVFAFGVAESAHDARLGTFMMLYVVLIAVTSLTEVAMLGIWLAVLCALQTISVQRRRSRRPATPGRRPPVAPPPLHRSAAS